MTNDFWFFAGIALAFVGGGIMRLLIAKAAGKGNNVNDPAKHRGPSNRLDCRRLVARHQQPVPRLESRHGIRPDVAGAFIFRNAEAIGGTNGWR